MPSNRKSRQITLADRMAGAPIARVTRVPPRDNPPRKQPFGIGPWRNRYGPNFRPGFRKGRTNV